jgi:hypothetical protein
MVVGAEPADAAGRRGDDGGRLAAPCALAIGPRADIQGILERRRDRTIMLRGDEENRVGRLDPLAERRPSAGGLSSPSWL